MEAGNPVGKKSCNSQGESDKMHGKLPQNVRGLRPKGLYTNKFHPLTNFD